MNEPTRIRRRLAGGGGGGGGLKAFSVEYSPDYGEGSPDTNSNTFNDIDNAMDITIAAAAGDVLMISIRGNFNLAVGNNVVALDYSVDGGAAVMNGNGVGMNHLLPNTSDTHLEITDFYEVQAGDVTNGTTTISALWKTNGSTLSTNDWQLTVINLGQVG